ncbi:MAG: GTPase HflX, partial [Chloroflexi bacterium]|nr:GTPase HflX [Chloroflexota bacterium]
QPISRSATVARHRPRLHDAGPIVSHDLDDDDVTREDGDTPVRRERKPQQMHSTEHRRERAYLVALDRGRPNPGGMSVADSVLELERLVETAGGEVVGSAVQRRATPDAAHYIGAGKLDEIVEAREETDYNVVIFDDPLSPSQQLNLERTLGVKVLDRSALILDIFAGRATTREAALQVELAQHEYLLPRLRGQWEHLERTGASMGAIGTRGPGETQLETDRRLIGGRIARLKRQIEQVKRQRALQRSRRQRQGVPVVALVGYTNAGKSSLMRTLAGAEVFVADAVFATLDPVTRRVGAHTGEAFLLTDTVGFMQKLPTQLISAFKATLEELETADLLVHVVDGTADANQAQVQTVIKTLADLGLSDIPMLTVVNKVDGMVLPGGGAVETEEDLETLTRAHPIDVEGEVLYTSALTGLGVDRLRDRLLYEFYGLEATRSGAYAEA